MSRTIPTTMFEVGEGAEEQGEMVKVDRADLGHATREQSVAEGGGEDHGEERGMYWAGASLWVMSEFGRT